MADWYDRALDRIGQNILALEGLSAPKIIPVDSGYTFSQDHEFLSNVPVGSRVAAAIALTSVTFGQSGEGWFDAANITVLSPTVGKIITGFVVYDSLATESTSPLLFHMSSGLGLPFSVSTAASIDVTFSANGLARL